MKRISLTLMLAGFCAAFLISALLLLDWLAVLRGVNATRLDNVYGLPLTDGYLLVGPRLLAAFLISFSVGTALLVRWLYWKRRFSPQLP